MDFGIKNFFKNFVKKDKVEEKEIVEKNPNNFGVELEELKKNIEKAEEVLAEMKDKKNNDPESSKIIGSTEWSKYDNDISNMKHYLNDLLRDEREKKRFAIDYTLELIKNKQDKGYIAKDIEEYREIKRESRAELDKYPIFEREDLTVKERDERKEKKNNLRTQYDKADEEIKWRSSLIGEVGRDIYEKAMEIQKGKEYEFYADIYEKKNSFGEIKRKIRNVTSTALTALALGGGFYATLKQDVVNNSKQTIEINEEDENSEGGKKYLESLAKTSVIDIEKPPAIDDSKIIENKKYLVNSSGEKNPEHIGSEKRKGNIVKNNIDHTKELLGSYDQVTAEFPQNVFGNVWMDDVSESPAILFESGDGELYSEIAYKNGEIILKTKNISTGEMEVVDNSEYADLSNDQKLDKYKEYIKDIKKAYEGGILQSDGFLY